MRADVNDLIVRAEERHRQHLTLPVGPVGDAQSVVQVCYTCWIAILAEALDRRSR